MENEDGKHCVTIATKNNFTAKRKPKLRNTIKKKDINRNCKRKKTEVSSCHYAPVFVEVKR